MSSCTRGVRRFSIGHLAIAKSNTQLFRSRPVNLILKVAMLISSIHDDPSSTNYPAAEKMQRCKEYIEGLEEERRKIQVFQRELPLCLQLVTQAIEAYKQQLCGTTTECNLNGQSECRSEQTSSDEDPVLEEFIPLKRASSSQEDDNEQQSHKSTNHHHRTTAYDDDDNNNNYNNVIHSSVYSSKDGNNSTYDDKASKKQDWLRSAQLWNQSSTDPTPKLQESPRKVAVMGVKRNGSGGAFHPFKREKIAGAAEQMLTTSTAEMVGKGNGGGGSKKEEKETQSQRKQRRCWSPELHRRFLQSLQQLGGPHVATPKQIRELMKVDGLSNDEVKSHLQKYRLHTRRPSPSIRHNGSQQAPQFVVVGGIWVPPPEYAAMSAPATSGGEAATSNGIYAPIATPPKQSQKIRIPLSGESGSHGEGGARRSDSPSTSSTTSHSS